MNTSRCTVKAFQMKPEKAVRLFRDNFMATNDRSQDIVQRSSSKSGNAAAASVVYVVVWVKVTILKNRSAQT